MALTRVQNLMIGGGTPVTENTQTVSTSYTITTNYSALAVGPITLSAGAVITVPAGSRWVIL